MDNINTTKSMKKASVQLEGKIQKTRDNMDALLAQAGCKGEKKVKPAFRSARLRLTTTCCIWG